MDYDIKYMRRALQLAKNGEGRVAPNPLVGAVIVARDRIIGEGFHATFGGPHAEVNAIASISDNDRHLLEEATIYVTLEPCSHFGKTPPCANLIVESGIKKVVVASPDPNPKVAGRGISLMRNTGIEVVENILRNEADFLNKRFITYHTLHRPWILLKWAQSADGYMAGYDADGNLKPVKFSSPVTSVWMHRERASVQAILVGKNTVKTDNPKLNVRNWCGPDPKIIRFEGHLELLSLMNELYDEGIQSLMVEGGPTLLKSFIEAGLYDEVRIETSPIILNKGLKSPRLPENLRLLSIKKYYHNYITVYCKNQF